MDFIFVTGKLGQGKTLACIDKVKQKIEKNCLVATNCDLHLRHLFHDMTDKPRVMRMPDRPNIFDFEMIGRGRPKSAGHDESKNGILLLDECGDWFNARNWQDKGRQEVNTWFRHARKLGWDVYLVVQDLDIIDSQARKSLAASVAKCKRMDKMAIPFLTTFTKIFFGFAVRPAKMHSAKVEDSDGILLDRWFYRGSGLYRAYDTEQIFDDNYPHGVYSYLTPWHVNGRHRVTMNLKNIMRITKIYWKKFSSPASFVTGCLVTSLFCMFFIMKDSIKEPPPQITSTDLYDIYKDYKIKSYTKLMGSESYTFTIKDGSIVTSDDLKAKGILVQPLGDIAAKLHFKGGFDAIIYR